MMASSAKVSISPAGDAITYTIAPHDLHAHLWRVQLQIARPAKLQKLSLPVWLAGSYMVREFSKHLQGLWAKQNHLALATQQLNKNTWQVACDPEKALSLGWDVYAHDPSVRTAWLDADRGFFNATSLCLRVHGKDDSPCTLKLLASKSAPDWVAISGLAPKRVNGRGFGSYVAANYDELADCPFELGLPQTAGGLLWQGQFMACGVPHRFVVAGAPASFDGQRLLQDTQKICEAVIRFWDPKGAAPMRAYTFMLNAVDDGYGGLEHRNSTALICKRADLPRIGKVTWGEGTTTLMGLISHEYFHTWNVKRLRPFEFARYQYDQEQYTQLLWFFEGFTSYYDDLLLRRAGLIDNSTYLGLLQKTLNGVLQTPGRQVQSVAEASFDAWVKYYRQDENTPNATVSYYTKGALVALCIDLSLREAGRASLDDVMREVWRLCSGGPMTEVQFQKSLKSLSGRDFKSELAQWVHSTTELPVLALLSHHGVAAHAEPASTALRLGLRCTEAAGQIRITNVLSGGLASAAGFSPGDEWLGIELKADEASGSGDQAWRMSKLDDLGLYAASERFVVALVARDKRLLKLTLDLQPATAASTYRLATTDLVKLDRWLAP